MSQKHHGCIICGKVFATPKAVYGHLKIHSRLRRIWGLKESNVCSISTSAKEKSSSFMTEFERREMNEAAMSLVMFSERVAVLRSLSPGDVSMDLELEPMQEKIIHCVESKQVSSEVFSHSGFEKSSTCSDVVAQTLPSTPRIKSQIKRESNSSYRCKICGKSFERSQALGGHQTLHRSIKGQLALKKDDFEGGNSLSLLTDSGAKQVVPKLSCFEVSQDELIELRDTNDKEHSVLSKQEFSELFSHSAFGKSGTGSDVVAQSLPSLLTSNLQKKRQSNSSYKCKTCSKRFWCSQALGGRKTLHRSKRQLACKKKDLRVGNSLNDSSEAKKIVSKLSNFEVSEGVD
ncbi:zinc finger protein 568 [Eutrema salsugineum]|uniref:zinc finger protein 568 n=1 Tax=Eutrema salsugineum TaxID=72664 RepID=UPI000CED23AC|nr:zinc finger protein 568 [Eutrema salsugineum]